MNNPLVLQVELKGNGPVSMPEVSARADADGHSIGPEAKPQIEVKGDEAADFWAALQSKQPGASGTAVVSQLRIELWHRNYCNICSDSCHVQPCRTPASLIYNMSRIHSTGIELIRYA